MAPCNCWIVSNRTAFSPLPPTPRTFLVTLELTCSSRPAAPAPRQLKHRSRASAFRRPWGSPALAQVEEAARSDYSLLVHVLRDMGLRT